MVDLYNTSENESIKENVPLAVLFSDGSYLNEELYKSRNQKLVEFVSVCNKLSASDLSEEQIVHTVIENALMIEFGAKVLRNTEMLDTIKDALSSDIYIRKEILDFAKRNFLGSKIDQTLIN